jgi:RNA polymerase sigma-70 factor (ECF subfamily)
METTSFHELYQAHARDVYRYALALSGNPADAEDIMMNVFFRAWTGEPLRKQSAKAYLLTIARNIFRDGRRKSWREQSLAPAHDELHAQPPRQDTQLELRETLRAMRDLPDLYRAPLEMWAAGGLTYQEIAAELRATVVVVKMRIHRARQMLAQKLWR